MSSAEIELPLLLELLAVSHDLRTPITRLRLRSEFIEDEAQKSRMLADPGEMRTMLEAVLSFLQNDRRGLTMSDEGADIMLALGEVLSLHDRKPHGLSVRISLRREQHGRRSAA